MAQTFDAALVDDDGEVGQPRLSQFFTAAIVPDEGLVLAPRLLREWGPNVSTPYPAGAPVHGTKLPETAVQVVDMDHAHVGWLPKRLADLARASLTDPGAVSATISRHDPAAAISYGDKMLRYWLRGELAACGVIDDRHADTKAQQEEAGENVVLGGPGSIQLLDEEVIDPWKRPWVPQMQSHPIGFMHPAYDASSWGNAYKKARQGDRSPYWTGNPRGWDDPSALWISGPVGSKYGAPIGDTYLRGIWYCSGGDRALTWTGDNRAELWIDGIEYPVIQNWTQLQRVDIENVSVGYHLIAVKLTNDPMPPPYFVPGSNVANPSAFLLSIREVIGRGQLGDVEFRTTTSPYEWRVLQYPAQTPGWPLGRVLNYFLDLYEVKSGRSILRTFTDTADTNGAAFPIITDMDIEVGKSPYSVIAQLCESYIDAKMAPGSHTLSVWNKGGRGRTLPVDFEGALRNVRHRVTPPIATELLMHWRDDYAIVSVPPPPGQRRRSVHLQVPQIPSELGAELLGAALLAAYGHEQIETTATVWPKNPSQVPGVAVLEGDTVPLPDTSGAMVPQQVQSWTAATNRDGDVTLTMEAGDIIAHRGERIEQWLQRQADGAIEGRTRQAGPARVGPPIAASTVALTSIPFQREPDITADESHPYPTGGFAMVVDASAHLGTGEATQGSDVLIEILVNGDWIGELTIEAGQRSGRALGLSYPIDGDDIVTCRITDTGFTVVVIVRFA